MATFVSLITFTNRGEEHIKQTVDRANAFCQTAEQAGASVKDVYWTLGNYDGVLIFEAPDEQTATALMLNLGSKGNVHTQTLTAFNDEQIKSILDRVS
jgi:uncharacterized protein with GYD domain